MEIIIDKLRSIIGETVELTVPIDSIRLEDDISRLGVNSISFVKMIVGIETEFGIEFDDEDFDFGKLKTLKELVCCIEKYINVSQVL